MRLNWETTIFGKKLLLVFQSMNVPKTPTAGISARVAHTTDFVPLFDYDNVELERTIDELRYLQELHTLGDLFMFQTSPCSQHVIGLDRMPLREALEVIYDSTCDDVFKWGVQIDEYRTWILRALEKGDRQKPKYVCTVESPYNGQRLQSQAHGKFLQLFYGVKVRLVNPDGNDILEIQGYKTSSKVSTTELLKELNKKK